MREAVQRRLSVEASELLTPLPLSFPLGVSSSVPQRFVTVNWGPTASCQHRSRGLRHRQGRNLNCSATRKCSRPVDGRRPQTFDPPGRLLGSAARDLLASPRVSVTEPVACRPRHRAKPPALLRPGAGQSAAWRASSARGLRRAYRTVASKGRSNPICRGRSRAISASNRAAAVCDSPNRCASVLASCGRDSRSGVQRHPGSARPRGAARVPRPAAQRSNAPLDQDAQRASLRLR